MNYFLTVDGIPSGLLKKHNISLDDVKAGRYKLVVEYGNYHDNPRRDIYRLRMSRGRNAKKDIDVFTIINSYSGNQTKTKQNSL